ncbi:hypothetical protein F383_30245 [Gossypium arboreum]|uniref:Uncharacterized protein n=1 Tax=Gossypium arboreum TaxID=29729 RepID=A0A0B0PCX0_GOSAR|nr:hypothetical protein F383_30245 [Gossypium arboreum]
MCFELIFIVYMILNSDEWLLELNMRNPRKF